MMDIPYFATNKEWFYINEDGRIVLTDKAPPEAVESLKQFHEAYERGREDDWFYQALAFDYYQPPPSGGFFRQ